MRLFNVVAALVCFVMLSAATSLADNSGRIYGKIYTVNGDELEGFIRWDRNEANWVDVLDGTKEIPRRYARVDRDDDRDRSRRDSRRRIELFGIRFYGDSDNPYYSSSAQSGIRFGYIKTLEVVDDDRAVLKLKGGEEVELVNGSTDLGDNIREIVVEDGREGEIELVWDDIDHIDFMEAPSKDRSNFGERLYGTVSTRRGQEFSGFICWDVDELFTTDVLDGESRDRKQKVPFGKIASIERYSSSGATVNFKSGDDVVLRGSNDVNSSNRGIIVCDPAFGQVVIDWDEFERLEFSDAPRQVTYGEFGDVKLIHGTVYTENGDKYEGKIRWDNDEEYTWELLDGDYRGLSFDIEFSKIKKIEKQSRGAVVTVSDGREFRLRDSNDIDEDNKGIYIEKDNGDRTVVDWDEFAYVDFDNK